MKELDVLLERFIEGNRTRLTDGCWPELEALLESEDDQLWRWLMDPSSNGSEPHRRLLESIRSGTV